MSAKRILMSDNADTQAKLVRAPTRSAHPAWKRQFLAVLASRIEP